MKGKERLILPTFDLYGKLIGDDNGDKRITAFAYKIRTNPKHALILVNILNKIAMKEANGLKFISYGFKSMGNKKTPCETYVYKTMNY